MNSKPNRLLALVSHGLLMLGMMAVFVGAAEAQSGEIIVNNGGISGTVNTEVLDANLEITEETQDLDIIIRLPVIENPGSGVIVSPGHGGGGGVGGGYPGGVIPAYNGPIFNGSGVEGGREIVDDNLDDHISKERDLKRMIIGWTNFALSIAALLAVVVIIWAGILYITALGDDGRMDSAKKIIIWAIVGILVIFIAFALVNTVIKGLF